MLIQETASIVTIENTGESPGLALEGLYVLDLNEEYIPRRSGVDVKRTGEIVNLGKID